MRAAAGWKRSIAPPWTECLLPPRQTTTASATCSSRLSEPGLPLKVGTGGVRQTVSALKVTYRKAVMADRDWLFELKRGTMRDYVAAIFGWDDAVQRRMFEEKFDPTRIRIIQVDGRDAGLF